MKENDFVSIWLEETGNPAIEELTDLNHNAATSTAKVLAEKVLTEKHLAIALDIDIDEIKRWLSGRHTFSRKTISEIRNTLEKLPSA